MELLSFRSEFCSLISAMRKNASALEQISLGQLDTNLRRCYAYRPEIYQKMTTDSKSILFGFGQLPRFLRTLDSFCIEMNQIELTLKLEQSVVCFWPANISFCFSSPCVARILYSITNKTCFRTQPCCCYVIKELVHAFSCAYVESWNDALGKFGEHSRS